jgi:hypothetical protein
MPPWFAAPFAPLKIRIDPLKTPVKCLTQRCIAFDLSLFADTSLVGVAARSTPSEPFDFAPFDFLRTGRPGFGYSGWKSTVSGTVFA